MSAKSIPRLLLGAFVVLALLTLATAARPSTAGAHASLMQATPGDGARLTAPPRAVSFRFSEPVEGALGAVRVFDGTGRRVDAGTLRRGGSSPSTLSVSLRPRSGAGAYTATYRVVSGDSHVISGGVVFRVGDGEGRAVGVAGVAGSGGGAAFTRSVFGAVRILSYFALLLGIGGLVFLLAAWTPAVRRLAGADQSWAGASAAFAGRLRRVLAWATALGVASSLLGIVCQAALAGGIPLWSAIAPEPLRGVLETRFGVAWGARALTWAAFGLVVLGPRPILRGHVLRPATLGAEGLAVARPLAPAALAVVSLLSLVLVASVGLSGHAATGEARWLAVPMATLHVLGMSAWLGALVVLLAALPAAARRLPPEPSRRLLAAGVRGVSRIALCSVALVLATGIVQSVLRLNAPGDLVASAYGLALLAKVGLFGALLAFGAFNQRRVLPRLGHESVRRATGESQVLWLSIGGELGVFLLALGATAALAVASPPPPPAESARAARELGPAKLVLAAEPLRVGAQKLSIALSDARTGRPYERFEELELTLRLPGRGIGPLPLELERSGAGRYAAARAEVTVPGDWELGVRLAVSDFDTYRTTVPLRVR